MNSNQAELKSRVADYCKYLDKQSPIVSDSHFMLLSLYRQFGVESVDKAIDEYFKGAQ